jgi:hypothetical protein
MYGGFHTITDELETLTTLTKVVTLDGTMVAKIMPFDEDNFTSPDVFEDTTPDEEDYTGYTGNEGCPTTHFYRRTVRPRYPIRLGSLTAIQGRIVYA